MSRSSSCGTSTRSSLRRCCESFLRDIDIQIHSTCHAASLVQGPIKLDSLVQQSGKAYTNCIYFYSLKSKELSRRAMSKVFGKTNLYRDPTQPRSTANHLEVQFGKIEEAAASICRTIQAKLPPPTIHPTANACQTITLRRKELITLRKFLFLMHYRNESVSGTNFNELRSRNASVAQWIHQFKLTKDFGSDIDFWLHGLRFYLYTEHWDIFARGEALRKTLSDDQPPTADPTTPEDWYAFDYHTESNYYFLSVCTAAAGSEFVLAGNSFGLWEGRVYGTPGAHKIYIMSPRVAIVLRRTLLRAGGEHSDLGVDSVPVVESRLATLPLLPPVVQYADQSIPSLAEMTDREAAREKMEAYRQSKKGEEDKFSFRVVQLSLEETQAINDVVLLNADVDDGSPCLTFLTPAAALPTLQAFLESYPAFVEEKREAFQPLLLQLLTIVGKLPSQPQAGLSMPASVDRSEAITMRDDLSTPSTDSDILLGHLLQSILSNSVTFPSAYNRAYLVFQMSTSALSLLNAFSDDVRRVVAYAVERINTIPIQGSASERMGEQCTPLNRLVDSLDPQSSDVFFAKMSSFLDSLNILVLSSFASKTRLDALTLGDGSPPSISNNVQTLIYEASLVGVASWLARNKESLLKSILFPDVYILV